MPLMHRKTMFRRTARRPWWCAALLCLAVLAGCEDVEERVWWAPDGSVAAVDGRPGLRLMQPDGTLTEPILDGTVAGVSWLPDGSGLVVARAISVATWDEAKALLPAEESQAIEAAAGMVPALVRTLRALDHLPTADGGFFRCPTDEVKDWALLHAVCARDRHGAELQAAMRSQPAPQAVDRNAGGRDREPADEGWAEAWRDLQDSKMPVWEPTFVPLADGAAAGPVRLGADVTALEPHSFFPAEPLGPDTHSSSSGSSESSVSRCPRGSAPIRCGLPMACRSPSSPTLPRPPAHKPSRLSKGRHLWPTGRVP